MIIGHLALDQTLNRDHLIVIEISKFFLHKVN